MEDVTPSPTLINQNTTGSDIHPISSPIYTKIYAWLPVFFAVYIIYVRYFTGISHIPGPFLASVSNIWKINAAWHKDMPQRNIALHQKYGPLVRIGPDMISIDDPAALNIIYGFKPIYLKTAFYPIVEALYNGKMLANIFTTRSEQYHDHLKRASVTAYSMTSLADLEPYVQYFGIVTLLSGYTNDKERPAYLSLVGFVWGLGTVLGPVVGVYWFLLPPFDPQPSNTPFIARIKHFDFVGAALSIASIICLVMAINFGNALYAWNSGQIIAMFVLSAVFLLAFAVQQKFAWLTTKTERMFPCHLLRVKEAVLLFVCAVGANAAGFLPIYYIPVYFQFSRGDNALEAAVRLLPLITILSATIMANGYLMSKLGYYQPWYLFGAALALVGNVLLSLIDTNTSLAAIYGYEVLVALGTGAFIQAGYATIQTVIPAADTSYAIAFMMLAQFTGISLGLSIGGAVFVNQALKALKTAFPDIAEVQLRTIISGTSSNAISIIPADLRDQAVSAIVDSLRQIFIPAYVGGAVAFVAAIFIKRHLAFHTERGSN